MTTHTRRTAEEIDRIVRETEVRMIRKRVERSVRLHDNAEYTFDLVQRMADVLTERSDWDGTVGYRDHNAVESILVREAKDLARQVEGV